MPDSAQKHSRQALALLWLVPALWTVNYIVARKAPGVIGPYLLAFGRWGLAALFLLLLTRTELWRQRADIAKVWRQYLILGTLGMMICGAWVYQGARSTGAMNIALIYSASPVLIGLGAVLWLGERFGVRQGVGVALAIAGVVHVVVKGQWTALAGVQFSAGDLWIVAATVSWAAYALLQKQWPSPLGATARLAAICAGGTLVLIPFTLWEMSQPDALPLSGYGLWLIVVAAIVPGLGAYWIYGWAQKILGASRVAVSLYLGPLYAGLAAWGVLGEPLGWHHAIGALLILPGVFLVTGRPPAPVRPPLPARS
ncbi:MULTISPECIES: DMT family transporter [unclassified Polaromonas]|uniref:DMT family transporter n=1 Tax=unclassified Polaromonas TaxID=2638319 RepID=UPI000F07FF80|nr:MULTISPECIES: DMT family transporter [unclassified Polaromonas]AYQ29999.1 DMT family transporter [Polaromonas sp. SP1]QGJ18886.1 EamA family transporter [Polaromonas sp. Pch-P]